jgi:hypothetical protein
MAHLSTNHRRLEVFSSLTTILPLVAICWCVSRLQLSVVELHAHRDSHEAALFDRMSTRPDAESRATEKRERELMDGVAADGHCPPGSRVMQGHDEGYKSQTREGNSERRGAPRNRISNCIEPVKDLHGCLRTQETPARCSSLSTKLKACVKAHTIHEHQDVWEWTRTRYGRMRVPGWRSSCPALTIVLAVLLTCECGHFASARLVHRYFAAVVR